MRIRNKLLVAFMFIVLLVSTIYTIYMYYKETNYVKDTVVKALMQTETQATSYLNYKLYYIDRIIDSFVSNERINEILSKEFNSEELNVRLKSQKEVAFELLRLGKSAEIESLNIYSTEEYLIGHQSQSVRTFEQHLTEDLQKYYLEQEERILWRIEPSNNNVIGSIWINDKDNYQKRIALLELTIDIEGIKNLININTLYSHAASFIVSKNNDILIASSNDTNTQIIEKLLLENKGSITSGNYSVSGKDYMVSVNEKINNGWRLVTIVDYKSDLKITNGAYRDLIIVAVMCILIAYILSIIISNKITYPIKELSKEMIKISKGNMKAKLYIKTDDEIGLLINQYNDMVENLEQLVKERFENGLEARKQEVLALEAQINPHFLYNILDSINWYAIKNELPVISETVTDLARFYKLSLNNGNDTLTLEEEMKYLTVYLRLMNLRYLSQFKIQMNIDSDLNEFKLKKLLLQPILENAIVHGILSGEQENGEVIISVTKYGQMVRISISDNGKGMTSEEQNLVMMKSEKGGYGMYNVKERLRMYYRDEAKIWFVSQLGHGTTFYLDLPRE